MNISSSTPPIQADELSACSSKNCPYAKEAQRRKVSLLDPYKKLASYTYQKSQETAAFLLTQGKVKSVEVLTYAQESVVNLSAKTCLVLLVTSSLAAYQYVNYEGSTLESLMSIGRRIERRIENLQKNVNDLMQLMQGYNERFEQLEYFNTAPKIIQTAAYVCAAVAFVSFAGLLFGIWVLFGPSKKGAVAS